MLIGLLVLEGLKGWLSLRIRLSCVCGGGVLMCLVVSWLWVVIFGCLVICVGCGNFLMWCVIVVLLLIWLC